MVILLRLALLLGVATGQQTADTCSWESRDVTSSQCLLDKLSQLQQQLAAIQEKLLQHEDRYEQELQKQSDKQQQTVVLINHRLAALEVKREDCSWGESQPNGVYQVYLGNASSQPTDVFCNMSTGGWLVIQRRMDGSQNFYRGWDDYTKGFGSLDGEFWWGNSNLATLTTNRKYKLRVDLQDFEGNWRFAEYNTFRVGGEDEKFQLTVAGYRGTAGDSLAGHNGFAFSTWDRDNDAWAEGNCVHRHKGAWWNNKCHHSSLNGLYLGSQRGNTGVIWKDWRGWNYSYRFAQMMVKPSL